MPTDTLLLPHLDAAYNLARWLMGNDADAPDVVQDACLRAIGAAEDFRGGDPRAWLLTIVRNRCFSTFRSRRHVQTMEFDETAHGAAPVASSPERAVLGTELSEQVQAALLGLAPEFREAIVLREFEGLSYKQIADVTGAPIGTVMSRLSRARRQLQVILAEHRRRTA